MTRPRQTSGSGEPQLEEPTDAKTLRVLSEAIAIVEEEDIPYVVIGGIPSLVWGRPGRIRDIDLFVQEKDAARLLTRLDQARFNTEKPHHDWLYKAFKEEVLVDVIFRVQERIVLDDEMVERGVYKEIEGTKMRLLSPEDLVITLAVSDTKDTHYWHNALAVLERTELDWDYFLRRAETGRDRALSLLLYARGDGLEIPEDAILILAEKVLPQP